MTIHHFLFLRRPISSKERKSMRKLLILAAVAAVTLTSVETQAAGRRVRPQASSSVQTPFSRLMDLERRKNAYLRQMFFGR